jgi:hypothetical protein
MKAFFSKSVGRLHPQWPWLLAGLILFPLAVMATDSGYTNTAVIAYQSSSYGSTVPYLPNIDATNFYNYGTWDVFTEFSQFPGYNTGTPYQTKNTLNYDNEGTMVGSVGWEFDYGPLPGNGGRGWSASFFNDSSGTIQAVDGGIYALYPNLSEVSFLLVSATNLVNEGTLEAGPNGKLVLNGGTVDLSLSQLMITGLLQSGGGINGTNFTLDPGLYGQFWAQTNMPANLSGGLNLSLMNSATLWTGFTVATPVYGVQNNCSSSFIPTSIASSGQFPPWTPTVSSYLDSNPTGSNEVRQAVFVKCSSAVTPKIRFTPSSNLTNLFQTVAVQLAVTLTNAFDLSVNTNTVYVVDTLGSETNRGLLVNSNVSSFYLCNGVLYQPANYIVSRSDPFLPQTGVNAFGAGVPGSGTPAPNFLYDTTMIAAAVTNTYSAYDVYVDDLASDPVGAAAANLPGRIQVNANSLDLTRTWIGALGGVSLQATNLVGSAGAVVDSQNLSFNLGSTNGYLNFINLAKLRVSRLQGSVNIWSALWTNYQVVTVNVTNSATNVIPFSVLIVDASSLYSQVQVTVQNLILHSTNITVSDSMLVTNSLLMDGQSFTLVGNLSIAAPLTWNYISAPTLRYFTNNGTLAVSQDAHFGDDTATNYAAFINNGTINVGGGETINSVYYQDEGVENATGGYAVTTSTGLVQNASITSGNYLDFTGSALRLNNANLSAGNQLNFNVTNFLSDNGAGSGNVFRCTNGFNLLARPATGDFLGTTFITTAPARHTVNHTWAGQDLGPIAAGFSNNATIGILALVDGGTNSISEPRINFSGTGVANGLYVGYLDISQCSNFLSNSLVTISSNLKIYFASSSVNPTNLDGQFGGHLIYVPGVAGQFASQNTKLSAGSYSSSSGGTFQFSITSQSGQTNVIQASTNLVNWVPIVTNVGPFNYTNTAVSGYPYRFYRVLIP